MRVTVYRTDESQLRLHNEGTYDMPYVDTDVNEEYGHPGDIEAEVVNIHDDITYQTVLGIGGAFTESAAVAWHRMPREQQARLIEAYFDADKGIGYNVGRLSIGSCDFSVSDYTYLREGDETLDSFDLSHDRADIFPMVQAAQQHAELLLFASPWSAPAFMKTNGSRIYGGHLKRKYYPMWADYMRRYVDGCRAEGIDLWALTLQNEPRHTQMWESCLYSVDEEIEFLGYLGHALEGTGVKILCYDHCRERVYERAKRIWESRNGHYCDGMAHHWYSGDHFGELRAVSERYADKYNVASEGCCAITGKGIQPQHSLAFAEQYAHDVLGTFRNGLNVYCDWNLTLDEENGPYHNREGRGCSADALVYCDSQAGELVFRLAYYYVGHISKFVRRGARVVAFSSYTDALDACAFKNENGEVVLVLLNRGEITRPVTVRMDGCIHRTELTAHSIATFVIAR